MTRTAYFHWRQRREHFWGCALAKAAGESGKRQKGVTMGSGNMEINGALTRGVWGLLLVLLGK